MTASYLKLMSTHTHTHTLEDQLLGWHVLAYFITVKTLLCTRTLMNNSIRKTTTTAATTTAQKFPKNKHSHYKLVNLLIIEGISLFVTKGFISAI